MKSNTYPRFSQLDGSHDFREAVPGGYVDYEARARRGGRVAYFNFELAREMGLIPSRHDSLLDPELASAILDAFSIQIINEYDLEHEEKIPKRDLLGRKYMATRYLQLQHPSRRGKTSGDGRSVWNGQVHFSGKTWDVTSCGTGATCLSPAAARLGFTPKTGDSKADYGCGKAEIDEGISAAIQSEVFHKNGIATERTLAVIAYEDGTSINVRAGMCLLRPSHFFHHLKQGNHERLKASIDYFIERQEKNGKFRPGRENRYFALASHLAVTFARMVAKFESEYIFVWLDWDGDNILADGGIIDYGSVRQFGLYHHAYRFDDGDRWSTTIPEQKIKARAIVQGFIQIADFLSRGKKSNLMKFRHHAILKSFDREFEQALLGEFLHKIGFSELQQRQLMSQRLKEVRELHRIFSRFEKASRTRLYRVPDGITRDAVYCMRDLLRELPALLLAGKMRIDAPETPAEFLELISSNYSSRKDRIPTLSKRHLVRNFLRRYLELVAKAGRDFDLDFSQILSQISARAIYLNPKERMTGESVVHLTAKLVSAKKRGLKQRFLQRVIEELVKCHIYAPESLLFREEVLQRPKRRKDRRVLLSGLRLVQEDRESI